MMKTIAHARIVAQARIDSPLGPITLAATERGLAGLWFDGQKHHPGPLGASVSTRQRWIAATVGELADYWHGSTWRGFRVKLDFGGTPFQQRVWRALLAVEPGATCSYGELAASIGAPAAARAVGAAVGRNPISIVVPCHRALGADGSLTGYAGGLDRKRALLAHERAGPLPSAHTEALRARRHPSERGQALRAAA